LQYYGNLGIPGALAAAETLETENKTSRFLSLGVVYDKGPLQLQAMLNRIRHEASIYQDSHAGYLLVGYRVGTVTPFVGASRWKSKPSDDLPVIGNAGLSDAYQQMMNGSNVDRTTYSIGARWDFQTLMALKVQWDSAHAQPGKDFSFRNSEPESNGKSNVLTVTLDFVF
jgi:hypothetical protein